MAKRKPWFELSESYRERLEKAGITPDQHRAGATLHKATGKSARAAKAVERKQQKAVAAAVPKAKRTRRAPAYAPAGVSKGSWDYWNHARKEMWVTDADWRDALIRWTWEQVKDLLRWKVLAHKLRGEGGSMANGMIPEPPVEYIAGNSMFFYG
jgi:hypothetical protein